MSFVIRFCRCIDLENVSKTNSNDLRFPVFPVSTSYYSESIYNFEIISVQLVYTCYFIKHFEKNWHKIGTFVACANFLLEVPHCILVIKIN